MQILTFIFFNASDPLVCQAAVALGVSFLTSAVLPLKVQINKMINLKSEEETCAKGFF